MAAKKKNFLNRELHPDTQSVAVGSVVSVLIAFALKSLLIAIPLGLAFALAHKHGLGKQTKKK